MNGIYRTLPAIVVSISAPYGETILLVLGMVGELVDGVVPIDI